MRYLVALSIGPVQDFIAASRRCRDLWRGSRILSQLSRHAALSLLEKGGPGSELIFPAGKASDDLKNVTVANKVLALVETGNAAELVAAVKGEMKKEVLNLGSPSHLDLKGLRINETICQAQLKDYMEFHAAWVPFHNNEYMEVRREVEEILAARKTLRNFAPYTGFAGHGKSSLDGGREDVIEGQRMPILRENECLDAMGVLKRFSKTAPPFDSTTDIALVPFAKGLRNKRASTWRRYAEFQDEQGWIPTMYAPLFLQEADQLIKNGGLGEEAGNKLKSILKEAGQPQPPYYALLQGDGDRIGGAISKIDKWEDHQAFSRKLAEFAREAESKITQMGGCPIYCGGDDVLALLPLDQAFESARVLNELFQQKLNNYQVTFSAGMAIAHALEPLSDVRRWAAEAEHAAKNKGGRNAICISVHPRSGVPIAVHGKWAEVCDQVSEACQQLNAGSIPDGLAFELQNLSERVHAWPELTPVASQMAMAIVQKKQFKTNDEKERARVVEFITTSVASPDAVDRFYRTLLVARWFARAKKEAEGKEADDN